MMPTPKDFAAKMSNTDDRKLLKARLDAVAWTIGVLSRDICRYSTAGARGQRLKVAAEKELALNVAAQRAITIKLFRGA